MTTAPAVTATGSTDHGLGPVRRRLCSEWSRVWSAVIIQFLLTVGFQTAERVAGANPVDRLVRDAFLSWVLFVVAYTVLTMLVFRGADPEQLRARLAMRSRRDNWFRQVVRGGDGPFLAVSTSATALGCAALLPQLADRQTGPDTTAATVLAIAASWTLSMVGYALHYGARDMQAPGLRFHGDDRPTFADYLYFSISVATTFGTTDTEVVSTRMRRTVSGHGVISFVFNTVIVALLVATLLPG